MKVSELIQILGKYNQELEVFVEGYEYGYEPLQENNVKLWTVSWEDEGEENFTKWIEDGGGVGGPYDTDEEGRAVLIFRRES